MLSLNSETQSAFHIDQMMRYSLFVPRLYNLCLSFGFEPGNIIPSRAFCSDESQGFPIILIAKHFGAFPFNHGRVGGIVATDRHGPHAHHGKDLVIIQASHVGYDADTGHFGSYCRQQTPDRAKTASCGKIGSILDWYQNEYLFACNNLFLARDGDRKTLTIDNQLLNEERSEGLFLKLEQMVAIPEESASAHRVLSTSRVFLASDHLSRIIPDSAWPIEGRRAIGDYLVPELFSFRRPISLDNEGHDHLEHNVINAMPWIITSPEPMLAAAQVNSQAEFDRTFRSIIKEPGYRNKRLLFISCLNIDISPQDEQLFPLTKCVPWAAYVQDLDGSSRTLEQDEITELLLQQSDENPDQINLETAIAQMIDAEEVRIAV